MLANRLAGYPKPLPDIPYRGPSGVHVQKFGHLSGAKRA